MTREIENDDAEFVFVEWDRRARQSAPEGLLELYDDDAVLESPLVPRILPISTGVLYGKVAIGEFLQEGAKRRPNDLVRWHRSGSYLWDGRTLSWEYLRATPVGDQIDIAEFMELRNGRIVAHRIYWGWFGVNTLIDNALQR